MKKRNLIAVLIASIVIFGSCEKNNSECELIPAKIIRYDCDRVIFQLLTSETIGDSDWEDVQTGQRYNNVVSYYNTCKIAEFANGEKVTLYVHIKEPLTNPAMPDCFQCQAVSQNPPQKKVDFNNISKTTCEVLETK